MANLKLNPYPPKVLPKPKYSIGSKFKNKDSEIVFTLIEIRQDTYILKYKSIETGESEFTLDYDYEVIDG